MSRSVAPMRNRRIIEDSQDMEDAGPSSPHPPAERSVDDGEDESASWGDVYAVRRLKARYEGLTVDQVDEEIQEEGDVEEEVDPPSQVLFAAGPVASEPASIYDIPSTPAGRMAPLDRMSATPQRSQLEVEEDEAAKASYEPRLPRHIQQLADSLVTPDSGEARIERDAKEWAEALNKGYRVFIPEVLKDERMALGEFPEAKFNVLRNIAASMHMDVLLAILNGNVTLARRQNVQVQRALALVDRRATYGPGIYLQELVDARTAKSPTPRELANVIMHVREYVKWGQADQTAHKLAYKIEALQFPLKADEARAKQGYRVYLERAKPRPTPHNPNPVHDWRPSATRIQKVKAFCDALEHRLQAIPPAKIDEPLRMPLTEVGYANDCKRRLQSHAKHASSNYVMNLFEAVFAYRRERGRFPGKNYSMVQHVVYNCFEPAQGILAEVFLTRLGHGYIYNGGGFSHYPAGLSNDSVLKKNPRWEAWEELSLYAMQYSPILANFSWTLERLQQTNRETLQANQQRLAEATQELERRVAVAKEEELKKWQALVDEAENEPGDDKAKKLQRKADVLVLQRQLAEHLEMFDAYKAAYPLPPPPPQDDDEQGA